jgi:hypothetical protein
LHLPAQSLLETEGLDLIGEGFLGDRVVDEVIDLFHHLGELLLMSLAQSRIGPHALVILGDFLGAEVSEAILIRITAEIDALVEELIEVELVLDQKGNRSGLEIVRHGTF